MRKPIDILGVPVHPVTYDEALEGILSFLRLPGQHHVVTANPEIVLRAHRDSAYRHILQRASLVVPDGVGLRWAAWFLTQASRFPHPTRGRLFLTGFFGMLRLLIAPSSLSVIAERVAGVDLVSSLAHESSKKQFSIFLLGGAEGVSAELKMLFEHRYPHVRIIGTYAGSPAPHEAHAICAAINAVSPDMLFVAYGAPEQEEWISHNLHHLPSVKVAMGVGGSFDFLIEKRKRAPALLRKLSLEWLFRLVQEPRRIRRIIRATILFPRAIFRQALH